MKNTRWRHNKRNRSSGSGISHDFSEALSLEDACYAVNNINYRKRRDRREEREAKKTEITLGSEEWLKKFME